MTPPDEQKLERLIHRAIHNLPPRSAPSSLESRVQAEIARRAALPWWHKSFAHWPMAARGAFILICAGVVKLLLMGVIWATAGFDTAQFKSSFAAEIQWLHATQALVNVVSNFAEVVLSNIPTFWLYGGIITIAGLYVALFGLGAAAYRTLYATR